MHETLAQNIKGYIDEKTEFNNNIFIRGWAFHEKQGVLPLRVQYNNTSTESEILPRTDVCNFYKRYDITLCGWRVKLPVNESGYLQMNVDDTWVNIFELKGAGAQKSSVLIIDDDSEIPNKENKKNDESQKITTNFSKIAVNNINLNDMNLKGSVDITITNDLNPPRFLVVDNFYKNPESIRNFALSLNFNEHKAYHKGKRTDECYRFPGLKEAFEKALGGVKITNWEKYGTNGCFQHCVAGDQLVYHCDTQQYAGIIYLTPDAPQQTGTSFYRSQYTKKMKVSEHEHSIVFRNGYLDPTEFDLVDTIGNVYNRLVLFDAQLIHAASEYFGNTLKNSRLFQLFFFDIEGYNRTN